MDRLFTRRGVMIGAGTVATAAIVPVVESAADESLGDAQPASVGVTQMTTNRVALCAFGSLELPGIFLGNERAIARERDINCRLYLATDGRLIVDDLHYAGERTIVQLSQEQHAALLAAFDRHASAHIHETNFHEPVQPKGLRS